MGTENIKKITQKIPDGIFIPLAFIALLWAIQIINAVFFGYGLNTLGIIPRDTSHLSGILFAPFLHGNYQHLISNTFMLIIFSGIICFYDKKLWYYSILYGTIIGGLITWLIGSHGYHVGASILIFSLWGTILGLAVFKRKFFFIFASIVFIGLYGLSIFNGLIPKEGVSFAGHLGGLMAGFLCSYRAKLK